MLLPSLLSEISSHDLEVAETLIGILRFVLIFVGARTLSEILVRLELPTILGELLAGVIIGASGLHLLVPPETQVQLSGAFADVIAGMAHIPAEEVPALYNESCGGMQSVATRGLYSLLFVAGVGRELDGWVAVGGLGTGGRGGGWAWGGGAGPKGGDGGRGVARGAGGRGGREAVARDGDWTSGIGGVLPVSNILAGPSEYTLSLFKK